MTLYIKQLEDILEKLILLSETPNKNTYVLCGVSEILINDLCINRWATGDIADTNEFKIIKRTNNGIVVEYKGNNVILQKSTRRNYCSNHEDYYHYDFKNKPLEEFNILNIYELDDDL